MLEVRRLNKSYRLSRQEKRRPLGAADPRHRAGLFHALRPVSFDAEPGQILGVLGPNGAGKTTLLRVLSTALRPSSGRASFDGIDIVADPAALRRRLGFLSGNTGLYGRRTAREMVVYFAELHGCSRSEARNRADALLELLGLSDAAHRRCDDLSTGMKQKVSIARTLVHDPDLVIMDEPTTGLDISAARTILEVVRRFRDEGRTVLLCTHHMHEVEALCDRVLVLRQGEARFFGTLSQLREQTGVDALDQALLRLFDVQEDRRAA